MPAPAWLITLHTLNRLDATFQSLDQFQPGQKGHYNHDTQLFERSWAARSLYDEHSGAMTKAVGQRVEALGRTLSWSVGRGQMFQALANRVAVLQQESLNAKSIYAGCRPWVQIQLHSSLKNLQSTLQKISNLALPALLETYPDTESLKIQAALINTLASITLPIYLQELKQPEALTEYTEDNIRSLFDDHCALNVNERSELIGWLNEETTYALNAVNFFQIKKDNPSPALIGLLSNYLENRLEKLDLLFEAICECHRNGIPDDEAAQPLSSMVEHLKTILDLYENCLADNLVLKLKIIQKIGEEIIPKKYVHTSLKTQLLAHQTVGRTAEYAAHLLEDKSRGFSTAWLEDCAIDARSKSHLNNEVVRNCIPVEKMAKCGAWKREEGLIHYWKSKGCSSSAIPRNGELLGDRQLVVQFDNFYYDRTLIEQCQKTVIHSDKWYLNFPLSYAGTWKSERKESNQVNLAGLAHIAMHLCAKLKEQAPHLIEQQEEQLGKNTVSLATQLRSYLHAHKTYRPNESGLEEGWEGEEVARTTREQLERQEAELFDSLKKISEDAIETWQVLKAADNPSRQTKEWCCLLEILNLLLQQVFKNPKSGLPIVDVLVQTELILLLSIHLKWPIHLTDKTGLDRAGFARALWESLKEIYETDSRRHEELEDTQVRRLEEILNFLKETQSPPDFSLDLGTQTDLLQESREKLVQVVPQMLSPYHRYLLHVTRHLLGDAQAIALVETGVAGLKLNHDAAAFAANWGANPWPIKRILSLIATREGRIVQLHDGQNFTYAGLQAIHRLSQLR